MTKQWVTAAKARELAKDTYRLCDRARTGLLEARAELFISSRDRYADVQVPASFWWAGGHEALEQNWQIGDFSTWIENRYEQKAFGVRFELEGVLACVPEDRRSAARRSCSVVGDPAWLSLSKGIALLASRSEQLSDDPWAALATRCEAGLAAARAVLAEGRVQGPDGAEQDWVRHEWDVPGWLWRAVATNDSRLIDRRTGTLLQAIEGPGGCVVTRLVDIHLAAADLEAMVPAEVEAPRIKAGGRPPLAFGEQMICEVWQAIYENRLSNSTQANLVDFMLDWAASKGHDLSETSAKQRAKMIRKCLGR